MVMIEIYCSSAGEVRDRLNDILSRHIPTPFEILHTENGKPYIKGNPVYFSVSHSKDKAVIAISRSPVGADLETYTKRERKSVVSRWSLREQAEILSEKDFLKHWTAREAYVKLYGFTIAENWKRIEYFGGKIILDGQTEKVKLRFYDFHFGVAAVCSEIKD